MLLPMPWKQVSAPDGDASYLALLSYLPLRSPSHLPAFLKDTFAIQRQVGAAPGVIGYSLAAQPWRLRFWTLSVWQDERHLAEFVRAIPHRDVMRALEGHMGQTQFIRWQIRGEEVPPRWSDALARQQPG